MSGPLEEKDAVRLPSDLALDIRSVRRRLDAARGDAAREGFSHARHYAGIPHPNTLAMVDDLLGSIDGLLAMQQASPEERRWAGEPSRYLQRLRQAVTLQQETIKETGWRSPPIAQSVPKR